MLDNIEYSKEWLTREIINTYEHQKDTGQEKLVKIKYIDLLNLFIKFVKLNEED